MKAMQLKIQKRNEKIFLGLMQRSTSPLFFVLNNTDLLRLIEIFRDFSRFIEIYRDLSRVNESFSRV